MSINAVTTVNCSCLLYIRMTRHVYVYHMPHFIPNRIIFIDVHNKTYITITWPASSPDLNPIENFLGILARNVYKMGTKYDDTAYILSCLNETWHNISSKVLHKLIGSMQARSIDLIQNKGW